EGPALIDGRDATLPDYREGDAQSPLAALVVINASERPLGGLSLRARAPDAVPATTPLGELPPLCTRKTAFRLPACGTKTGDTVSVEVDLLGQAGDKPLATAKIDVRIRRRGQSYKQTFVSDLDGSVQYFAVQPACPDVGDATAPALVLTLHGAGVEA